MTLEIAVVFAILGVSMFLFITGWIRADVVALLVLVALAATGSLEMDRVLVGFSSEATIAIAGLLVLSAGLVRTGVIRWIAERLSSMAGGSSRKLSVMSSTVPGVLSGLVSDIATVSLFIPVVLRLARKNSIHRSRLLLPIAMAALAGGNLTIIGASHNLVVNNLLESAGGDSFSFFEIAPLGLALIAGFAAYSLTIGQRLLPGGDDAEKDAKKDTRPNLMQTYELVDRLWEVLVNKDSPLVGKNLSDLSIGQEFGLAALTVVRQHESMIPAKDSFVLEADDMLLIGGRRTRVDKLVQAYSGLQVLGHPSQPEEFPSSNGEMIELAVPPRSAVIGRTLRELEYRSETGLTGVAIWRQGKPVRTDVGTTPLQEGDALLLYGPRAQTRSLEPGQDFLWLTRPRQEEAPRELRHLGKWAALIMAAVIGLAAFDLLPIAVAALGGAALLVLTGALTPAQMYEHVEWRTIVLVGGMYPLGLAMEESGAAGLVSEFIAGSLGALGPLVAMTGIALVAIILTQALHGAAVAVIMTPVALDTAAALGVEPKTFAAAVIVGAAATYLMPVGHPAALLVQRPGGYESRDYLKYGSGLVVITLLVIAGLIPLIWPF